MHGASWIWNMHEQPRGQDVIEILIGEGQGLNVHGL